MFKWKEKSLGDGILRQVEVSPSLDFLSSEGSHFIAMLRDEVDRTPEHNLKARIIVCRSNSAHDELKSPPATSLLELSGSRSLSHTVAHLLEFRETLENLQSDEIPWVFVGFSDCMDLLFEVALSCKFRFLFGMSLRVGFPSIFKFMLPVSKAHENLVQKNILSEGDWYKTPVREAFEAYELGLLTANASDLSYLSPNELMEDFSWLQRFLSLHHATSKLTGVKSWFFSGRAEDSKNRKLLETRKKVASNWMLKLWQDLAVWLDQIKMDELTPQKFFLVLEEKDKKYPRDHRFFIRVFLHAFNSHSKLSFSQRKTQSQDWYGTRVYINCAQLAPPERVLKELIGKKIECVFWHNRADDLQKTLHLIQSRLERSFSIGDAEKFWERYSSWCVRSSAPISSLRLSFGTDDFLNVNGHKAYRLSSNRGHAPLGILEWFKPRVEWMEISEVERQIFQILSEDVIFTGGKEGLPAPLAALVRVIACEEIVRLGSQKGFSVSVVMESLREIGWSFLGDEKTLDRFLSKYWSKVSFAGSSLRTWQRIGGVKSVESVRQLKSLRIDKEQKDILTDANAVIISEHFFFLAFALYRILLKSQEFADASTIKTFVGSALGLPPMCPTVDLTISRFGIERLEYQIKARWFWLDSQLF